MAIPEYYDKELTVGPTPGFIQGTHQADYYPKPGVKLMFKKTDKGVKLTRVSGKLPGGWADTEFELLDENNGTHFLPKTHDGNKRPKKVERLYAEQRLLEDAHEIWFIDNGTELQCIAVEQGADRETGGFNNGGP